MNIQVRKQVKSVSDYADGLDWVFINTPVERLEAIIEHGAELSSAMSLLLDIHWISEAKLRRDLYKRWHPERFTQRREVV